MHFICGVFCTVTSVRNFGHKSITVSRVWNPLEGANHWMVLTIPNNGDAWLHIVRLRTDWKNRVQIQFLNGKSYKVITNAYYKQVMVT